MDSRVQALEEIDHDHSNKGVLDGITAEQVTAWDNAQANVIEKIVFNGTEVTVDNQTKTVTLNTPADYITGLGESENVLSVVDGKLSSALNLNYYKGENGEYEIQLVGKNNTVIGRVDAKDFVKDGMLHNVELKENPEGQAEGTYLVFTWNNEAGVTAPMYVPVTSLMDVYNAGNGLDLDGKTFSISLQSNEKYLEVTEGGLATKGIDDAITNAKNAMLGEEGDAASAGTIYGAKKYAEEKAAAAQAAAEATAAADATTKANAAQAAAEATAAADATTKANAAQAAAEATAAADATTKANAAQAAAEATAAADATTKANAAREAAISAATDLNTAMDSRVQALEEIDHDHSNKEVLDGITAEQVTAWDAAETNAKSYADTYFVTKAGFNEFEAEYEDKLNGIAAGAEVNVVEGVSVNGIVATVNEDKVAEVTVGGKDIKLGVDITGSTKQEDGSFVTGTTFSAETKMSTVIQSIQDSIRAAVAGGVNSVTSGDDIVEVNNFDSNNPKVSLKVEASTVDTVAAGHIEVVKGESGLYAAMYYDGDDVE